MTTPPPSSVTPPHAPRPVSSRRPALRLLRPTLIASLLLAIQLAYLFYGIEADLKNTRSAQARPLATLIEQNQTVRRRDAGTVVWRAPTTGDDFFREDALATLDGSSARVRLVDGSELAVEPGSLILFEDPPTRRFLSTPSAIRIRLVQGSIKRVKPTSPLTSDALPLLLDLGPAPTEGDPATSAPLRLEDPAAGTTAPSIFRVVYESGAYEVIVESGRLRINDTESLERGERFRADNAAEPPRKLPAPRLLQPTIEIEEGGSLGPSAVPFALNFFLPVAYADTSPPNKATVRVRLAWEPLPGAVAYRIEVAEDEGFLKKISEERVNREEFTANFPAPTKDRIYFFRVAGLDEAGRTGEFSPPGKIEIRAKTPVAAAPVAPPPPAPKPLPKMPEPPQKAEGQKLAPPPAPTVTRASWSSPPKFSGEIASAAGFHSRTLKSSTGLPSEAKGSGFIPASLQALLESERRTPGESSWAIGGEWIPEEARIDLPSGGRARAAMTQFGVRLWWMKSGESVRYGLGPSLDSRHELAFVSGTFTSTWKPLVGISARLTPNAEQTSAWRWELQPTVHFAGGFGAQIRGQLRRSLFSPSSSGFFAGIGASARLGQKESGLWAAMEVGNAW